ncbi:MAG: hypothetical protein ACJASD_000588 [Sphingomonas echinoides]|jgi:hypothetical protein
MAHVARGAVARDRREDFYRPTPPTKEVLKKRIRYLIDNSVPKKGAREIFLFEGHQTEARRNQRFRSAFFMVHPLNADGYFLRGMSPHLH